MTLRNPRGLEPADGGRGLRCGVRRARQVVLWMIALYACAWSCRGRRPPRRVSGGEAPATPAWTSLGLGGGGAMYTPAISPVDPNLILLGCDMSGAYRTTDGGRSWEMIHYRQLTGSTTVRPAWHPAEPGLAFAVGRLARAAEGDAGQGADLGERPRRSRRRDRDRDRPRAPGSAPGRQPARPRPVVRRRQDVGGRRAGPRPGPGIPLRSHQPGGSQGLLRRHRPGDLSLRRWRRDLARHRRAARAGTSSASPGGRTRPASPASSTAPSRPAGRTNRARAGSSDPTTGARRGCRVMGEGIGPSERSRQRSSTNSS